MSYKIELGTHKIDIKVDKGLYRFFPYSAQGKTRLVQLFNDCIELGYNVRVFTPFLFSFERLVRITKGADIYLFDRYDQYSECLLEDEIVELGKHAIVILDIKLRGNITQEMKLCSLHMIEAEHIVVMSGKS